MNDIKTYVSYFELAEILKRSEIQDDIKNELQKQLNFLITMDKMLFSLSRKDKNASQTKNIRSMYRSNMKRFNTNIAKYLSFGRIVKKQKEDKITDNIEGAIASS